MFLICSLCESGAADAASASLGGDGELAWLGFFLLHPGLGASATIPTDTLTHQTQT